jgi:cytochrome P450
MNDVKWTVLEEYWHSALGVTQLPPILAEFSGPLGMLIISDPDLVKDLYFAKNQHMEKSTKMQRILSRFIGHSILFDRSDQLWAEKRRHLSAAFYKDKLQPMMETIIAVTQATSEKWVSQGEINISAEVSDLITECVLQCVFGTSSETLGKLAYIKQGEASPLYPGQFLKHNFVDHMRRQMKVYR